MIIQRHSHAAAAPAPVLDPEATIAIPAQRPALSMPPMFLVPDRAPILTIPAQRRATALESPTVRIRNVSADAPTVRLESIIPGRSRSRSAYSVWAVAFAVAVVVHEWQVVVPLVSVHTLAGVMACFVLLRPSAVWRTMVLCGLLAVEFVSLLPNPYSHALLAHLSAAAVAVWWAVLVPRSRSMAHDRGEVFERITPFLRSAFLLAWFTDAISKVNTDFLSAIGSCAPNVINDIPLFHVSERLYAAVAITTLVLEFAIPTLLMLRPTRSIGVVLALVWYLLIAAGGNPAHAALMFSFVLLFLPTAMLVTAGARMRMVGRRLASPQMRAFARSRTAPLVLAAVWLAGLTINELLPFEIAVRLSRWTAIAIVVAWLLIWVHLLVRHHRQWLTGGDRSTGLRIREGVLLGAMALLVVNSASPYIGLKTDWSFSQYGNLRTEAGHWNHLLIPEAVRVFHTQDQLVRLVDAKGDHELLELVDRNSSSLFVVTDARRLLAEHPDGVLDYEIDGVLHHAPTIGDDPLLGGGVSPVTDLLGRYRRIPLAPTCQF